MAVVVWPDDASTNRVAQCVICKNTVPLVAATIGLRSGEERQAFACNAHLGMGESARFLRAWVDCGEGRDSNSNFDPEGEGNNLWQISLLNTVTLAKE